MTMEDTISQDLKAAMLDRDAQKVSVLRSLKSAFTYVKVAPGYSPSENGSIADAEVMTILAKEAKKRQESADSFAQAGQTERADIELAEKSLIEAYLPAQLDEAAVRELVLNAVEDLRKDTPQDMMPKMMGQLIATVKQHAGPTANGALIARLVKESLMGSSR